MSKSIQLVRRSTIELPNISSYKLTVQAVNPEDMSSKIFVKQRIRNFAKESVDDVFVAVCTPTQLEDFEEDAPGEGSSYFRTDTIELVARTPEVLMEIFDSLVYETKKLVVDLTDLETLSTSEVFTITATSPVARLVAPPTINTVVRDDVAGIITVNFTDNTQAEVLNYHYSLDGGVTWRESKPRIVESPLVIQETSNNTTYNLTIRAYRGGNSYGASSIPVYVAPSV